MNGLLEIVVVFLNKTSVFYFIIMLGFVGGRWLKIRKEAIAPILIYFLNPVIMLEAGRTVRLSGATLLLIPVTYVFALLICIIIFRLGNKTWNDNRANIAAYTASGNNVGFFGLPVMLALFGQDVLGTVGVIIIGIILFGETAGFYLTARGRHTIAGALWRVATLPSVYLFILGILLQLYAIVPGAWYSSIFRDFQGAFAILGILMIGLGMADVSSLKWDMGFIGLTFLGKFILCPLLFLIFIGIDITYLQWYDASMHQILVLLSIMPLPTMAIVYASHFDLHPEKAALTVSLSTLVTLILIPFVLFFT